MSRSIKIVAACFLLSLSLGAAAASAGNFLYITGGETCGCIEVIDAETHTIVANINLRPTTPPIFPRGPWGIAITPDKSRAYVPDLAANRIWVIDTATNTVAGFVLDTRDPLEIAITPDGKRAYVTHFFTSGTTISVIDTDPSSASYNTVIDSIPLVSNSSGIVITPDGTRAYVTFSNRTAVIDIDPTSPTFHTVITLINTGQARGVNVKPDGSRVYVTNNGLNTVQVVDTDPGSSNFNTVIATVIVGLYPIGVDVTPDGTRAYVSVRGDSSVSVIDTATNTVVDTFPVSGEPQDIRITPDGKRAYTTNAGSKTVSEIDTTINAEIGTIAVDGFPLQIAILSRATEVAIDIKPGSSQNTINLSSQGVIPVAILSSNEFDATNVDPNTIFLSSTPVRLAGQSGNFLCNERDVNGDGLTDIVCDVETGTFMEPGDSQAELVAETFEGQEIRGQDFIQIVP